MNKTKRNTRGFTVIEMLITLALMAVMLIASIGIGRSSFQRGTFTSSVNRFVADFSFARQLASRENRYVAIVFNDKGNQYTIRLQDSVGDIVNFTDFRKNEQFGDDTFFDPATTTDFVVNSMGIIKEYPMKVNGAAISVEVEFIKKNYKNEVPDYKKKLIIYPSGGIKIED